VKDKWERGNGQWKDKRKRAKNAKKFTLLRKDSKQERLNSEQKRQDREQERLNSEQKRQDSEQKML
jgi:hypothetical protein